MIVSPALTLLASRSPLALAGRTTAAHVARFHTAAPVRSAQPGPSQSYIKGTVNDPTTFPPPSKSHGSYHWTAERAISAALIPLIAATAVSSPNPILDGVLGASLIMHSHIGFDACLVDYVHARKFPIAGPAAKIGLYAATLGALVGVYEFNTNDIGLTELVKKAWTA